MNNETITEYRNDLEVVDENLRYYEKRIVKSAKEIVHRLELDDYIGFRGPCPNPMAASKMLQKYITDMEEALLELHGWREKQAMLNKYITMAKNVSE